MSKIIPLFAILSVPVLASPTLVSAAAVNHGVLENLKSERVVSERHSDAIRFAQRCFNYGGQVRCF
jgi:hypothetical protein